MYCKYQRLVFCRRGILPADRIKHRTKGADASVECHIHSKVKLVPQLLYLSVQQSQCSSYAIRSQSVLTTNSTGRVYKVQFECRARHSTYTSEIASIACLHNFFRNTLLSCDLSASRQSTVDSFVHGELYIISSSSSSCRPSREFRWTYQAIL